MIMFKKTNDMTVYRRRGCPVCLKFACMTAVAGMVTAAVGGVPYLIMEFCIR
ncbi:MAG: hypothetical protein IIY35_04645 [Ruminococcus sp.]|nr:hypothetical protein [Ruminococcus sp.]